MRKMTLVFCGSNQAFVDYLMKHQIHPKDALYAPDQNYAIFFAKMLRRSWMITSVRLVFSLECKDIRKTIK